MTKTFTFDDVIRFVYSETSPEENDQITQALKTKEDLMSFYLDTLEIKNQMNLIQRQPSRGFVQQIMNYSAMVQNHLDSVSAV